MSALIFDTETTGLPFYGSQHPADADYQPRMCSIAMALVDDEGAVVRRYESLIKPVGWPLDNELFVKNMDQAREKAHGLTFERLEAEGRPIEDVADVWDNLYSGAEFVAGYNIWFDHKIARGELKRLGRPIPFRDKKGFCLMKASTDICKIPRMQPGGGNKFPKLAEAVEIILKRKHERAHDARGDLDATIELYQWFAKEGLIAPEDQPEARKAPAK